MIPAVIGIDVSTTSARAVVVDEGGRALGIGAASFSLTGGGQQDPAAWWLAVERATTTAVAGSGAARIRAVGIASQGVTVMPVNDAVNVAPGARSWLSPDDSTVEVDERAWFARSGRRLTSSFLAVQAADRRRAQRAQPERWALVGESIAHALTGRWFVDPSLASTTGLVNPRTRSWDPVLLRAAGLREDHLGRLDLTGCSSQLDPLTLGSEAFVVAPIQDQRAVSLATAAGSDDLIITLGTAAAILARTEQPVIDPDARIPVTPAPGTGWELEGVVAAGGAAVQFGASILGFASVVAMLDAAADAPAGSGGVSFTPHLAGATSPTWVATAAGAIGGLRVDSTRGSVARAVVEGLAREILLNADIVSELAGRRSRWWAVGGLARHPLLPSILAAISGHPLVVPTTEHATALGAAARAAEAIGWDARPILRTVADGARLSEPDPALSLRYQDLGWAT